MPSVSNVILGTPLLGVRKMVTTTWIPNTTMGESVIGASVLHFVPIGFQPHRVLSTILAGVPHRTRNPGINARYQKKSIQNRPAKRIFYSEDVGLIEVEIEREKMKERER